MKYWLFNRNPYKLHFRIPPKQKKRVVFFIPYIYTKPPNGPLFFIAHLNKSLVHLGLIHLLLVSCHLHLQGLLQPFHWKKTDPTEHRSNGNVFVNGGEGFWKNADFVQVVKNTPVVLLLVLGVFFFGLGVIAFGDLERWELIDLYMCRWFKLTFLSPSWRSLNPWKGHLTIPKGHFESPGYCWYGESTII